MEFIELIDKMTPAVYRQFRESIATGRWPDGQQLTDEQRELCLQAVIAYEARHVPESERVGYIDRGPKREGERCSGGDDEPDTISWVQE